MRSRKLNKTEFISRVSIAKHFERWTYKQTHNDILSSGAYLLGYFSPEVSDWTAKRVVQELAKPRSHAVLLGSGFALLVPNQTYAQIF
jgi:hypothetical protein